MLKTVMKKEEQILEPFDPSYGTTSTIPELSSYEKRFLRKVSTVEKKLRKNKILFEWMHYQRCFRLHKYIFDSEYPTYRYVYINMEENDYSFGTEKEDLVFDRRASVVIEAAIRWLNSKMIEK